MDEATVRQRAQAHARATMAGDLRTAGADLDATARSQAPGVMKKMPNPITSAEVVQIEPSGDDYVATILYGGPDSETVVRSRWTEREANLVISDLEVV